MLRVWEFIARIRHNFRRLPALWLANLRQRRFFACRQHLTWHSCYLSTRHSVLLINWNRLATTVCPLDTHNVILCLMLPHYNRCRTLWSYFNCHLFFSHADTAQGTFAVPGQERSECDALVRPFIFLCTFSHLIATILLFYTVCIWSALWCSAQTSMCLFNRRNGTFLNHTNVQRYCPSTWPANFALCESTDDLYPTTTTTRHLSPNLYSPLTEVLIMHWQTSTGRKTHSPSVLPTYLLFSLRPELFTARALNIVQLAM